MEYLYKSPIGFILLKGNDEYLSNLDFISDADALAYLNNDKPSGELLNAVIQLDEYFKSERKSFDLNLKTEGTPFREKVWEALRKIPYGETISYKQLAVAIGNQKAVRAVGGANHHNKISIIIPCHRVIGAGGKLVGYGGELWRKEWLLNHEKASMI